MLHVTEKKVIPPIARESFVLSACRILGLGAQASNEEFQQIAIVRERSSNASEVHVFSELTL